MAASALKRLLLSPKSLLSSSSASRLFYTTAGKPWPPAGFDTSLPPPLFRPFPQPSFAYETEEALHVREDMPGVEKEGVEVIVKPYLLLLKGERKMAKESGDPDGVFVYGYYYNVCEKKYHLSQVKASFRNGVLTAVIPKVKGYGAMGRSLSTECLYAHGATVALATEAGGGEQNFQEENPTTEVETEEAWNPYY